MTHCDLDVKESALDLGVCWFPPCYSWLHVFPYKLSRSWWLYFPWPAAGDGFSRDTLHISKGESFSRQMLFHLPFLHSCRVLRDLACLSGRNQERNSGNWGTGIKNHSPCLQVSVGQLTLVCKSRRMSPKMFRSKVIFSARVWQYFSSTCQQAERQW